LNTKLEYYKNKIFEDYEKLRNVAKKHCRQQDIEDAAFNYMLTEISKNNWKRLLKCESEAYLYTMVKNLIIDYDRKQFGRYRTPKWVEQKGGLWIEIHKYLRLHNFKEEEIIEKITEKIKAIISEIYDKEKKHPANEKIDEQYESYDSEKKYPADDQTDELSPHNLLLNKIIKIFGQAVFDEIDESLYKELSDKIKEKITLFRSKLFLETKDRLFLKMIYHNNVKIYQAGNIVFGLTQRESYDKYDKLRVHILEVMKETQIESELKDILK